MARRFFTRIVLPTVAFLVCCGVILYVPNMRVVTSVNEFLAVLLVLELGIVVFEIYQAVHGTAKNAPRDIVTFVILLMLFWEIITAKLNVVSSILVPCPEQVFMRFSQSWPDILANLGISAQLLAGGFVLGMGLAVVLGILAGWLPRLRGFFYPIASIMAPIPATVFAPYIICLAPSFQSSHFFIVAFGVFWLQFLNTVVAIGGVNEEILDNAKALHFKGFDLLRYVLIPAVVPSIVDNLRVSVTMSVLMLNFAEMLAATDGIGAYIKGAQVASDYVEVVLGIIVIAVCVIVLISIISVIERRAIRWRSN